MLELTSFELSGALYKSIYTFHMPVFIFINGFFSKFNRKKIIFTYIALYIIFQPLYILFENAFAGTSAQIQFTYPKWIMWYMLNTVYYLLLIPFYNVQTTKKRVIVLMLSFMLALVAGFDKSIGYPMSLSRFFVFQPYFLMGYYYKKEKEKITEYVCGFFAGEKWAAWLLLNVAAFFGVVLCAKDTGITINQCYGSYAYASLNDIMARIKLYICATTVTAALIADANMFLNKKIPCISMIGKNTLPVYLLHGFIIILNKYGIITFPPYISVYILLAFCITLIFGNNLAAKCFKYIIPSEWFEKRKSRK